VIVPYPPGGTSDILARALGPGMQAALGQPWIVENKPGATGNVGADFVAKSPPDGYTILLARHRLARDRAQRRDLASLRPGEGLRTVVMVAYSPHLLVVHPSVAVKDVKELIAQAKAKPDALNFAVSGSGGANHLAGIDFAQRAGIKWTYIPYKGGSQALTDMVGGQAQVMFNGALATYPVREGRQAEGARDLEREALPDDARHPTVAEAGGMPGFETGSYQGIVAPAGTPEGVVDKIHATVTKVLATPEVKERLDKAGAELRPQSSADFGAFIRTERDKWAKVVKESGAKFD
jgi:tripartite-type tricarboxylate transporter receptor subunit TctC